VWALSNLNYLPKTVAAEERTLTVAIHGAVTACIGGMAPILWGWFLKGSGGGGPAINVDVFQWFFLSVLVSVVCLSWLVARLPEDKSIAVEPLVIGNAVLRPFRAATYLINLIDLKSLQGPEPRAESSPKPPPGR
jgi:hypothetical protein